MASEGENNFHSHFLDRRMSLSEVERKINAVVGSLVSQSGTLIQSVRDLIEAFELSRSLDQRLIMVTAATRLPRSDLTTNTIPFHERRTQDRYSI